MNVPGNEHTLTDYPIIAVAALSMNHLQIRDEEILKEGSFLAMMETF